MAAECDPWIGYVDHAGYGRAGSGERYVHRRAWIAARGPIPQGQEIHHLCENKLCQNVEHMELRPKSDHARLHAHEKWGPDGALRRAVCRKS